MTTLVLIRHGEIIRPLATSNFDPAPLSPRGRREMEALARAWPASRPTALLTSPLRRAFESADVLGSAFELSLSIRSCLTEWAADLSGISQLDYVALEARCWEDLDFVPPSGESLRMAGRRARACIEGIAASHGDDTVAVVGHGTLFSLLTSELQGIPPSPAYKASIGFAHAAIVEAGSGLRLVRDFSAYGVTDKHSKPL